MFLTCVWEKYVHCTGRTRSEEPLGGSGVVSGPLNISSGKCCKTLSSCRSQPGQHVPRPSLPHLNNQGSDLPSNAIMLYPSFFLSCQLNFCMLKKIFFPESTFMKSHYSVRALLPRSSNSRGCYKKKHLCTLSPNPNFLLGSKINLGQLCASTSRRGGRPHLAK